LELATAARVAVRAAGPRVREPDAVWLYDPQGLLYSQARQEEVSAVVLLNDRLECLQKAGKDLEQFYTDEGLQVVALPIRNYDAVSAEAMGRAVGLAIDHASEGGHLLIHCSLGIGRTGMFAACMAHQVLGLNGDDAIRWIRKHIGGAVETGVQEELVRRFASNGN
jgi:protein-tyrosine phosphatase